MKLAILAGVVLFPCLARGGILTFFDFNGADLTAASVNRLWGSPSVSQTGNDVVLGGQEGVADVDADGVFHDAGEAIAFNRGVNDGGNSVVLTFQPSGNTIVELSYDYRSTAISPTGISYGPPGEQINYRLDGTGVFSPLVSESFVRDSQWHASSYDLSAISAFAAASQVEIQFVPQDGADLGTLSFDNMELSNPVPEPTAMAAVGLLGLLRRRNRDESISRSS